MAIKSSPPATATGLTLPCSLPVPSRPPLPQQNTAVSRVSAQVWLPPGATKMPPGNPITWVGTLFRSLVPSPISPSEFFPQQYVPLGPEAHTVACPAALAPIAIQEIWKGTERSVGVLAVTPNCPLPSSPSAPLPQQYTSPTELFPQTVCPAAARSRN